MSAATQYQFVLERRRSATSSTTWVPQLRGRGSASCRSIADVASDNQQGGLAGLHHYRPRHAPARFGITPATVDNALYDAFGQRIVSTIFTQSNQYRVILEADPALQQSLRSLSTIYLPSSTAGSATGAARCRCRPSPRSSERPAPLQISHLGQFPATTISFNLAPGVSLGAGGARRSSRRKPRSACRAASSPASRARRWHSSRRSATSCF